MHAFSPQRKHGSTPSLVAQWWRHWIESRADELLEAARLGGDELEYLTRDIGPSASELRTVAAHGGDEADLLRRRMVALDLDPYELALSEPALIRHLQGRCALCESRGRCVLDLAHEGIDSAPQDRQDWRDYCPNATTLNMLGVLQSCSKIAPTRRLPHLG
jgi:transposase-like protein